METIFVLVSKEAWNKKQQEVIDLRKENERLQKENTQLQQESQRLRKDPDLFEMSKSRSVESRIEALETAGLEQFKDILRLKETFCNCPVKKFDDFEKRVNQQGFDVRNLKESMDDHNKRLCNLEFGIEPVMRVLEAVKKVADEMAD